MMYTQGFEQWLKKSNEIMLDSLNNQFSRYAEQMQRLSKVKNPVEFLTLQKECLHENMHAFMEAWQKLSRSELEQFEECMKSCGSSFQEQVKTIKTMSREKEEKKVNS